MQLLPVLFGIRYRRATLHLDIYLLRDDVTLRPVGQDEVRIVQPCGDIDVAKIIKRDSLAVVASVLPNELEDVDLCTLAFDEGSQCTALCGFTDGNDAMILYCYDKIHRIIRDIKLAYTHVCNGVFLKSQVYSSHIWSMNIRPFNSRTVGVQKRRSISLCRPRRLVASISPSMASALPVPWVCPFRRMPTGKPYSTVSQYWLHDRRRSLTTFLNPLVGPSPKHHQPLSWAAGLHGTGRLRVNCLNLMRGR